MGARCVAGQMGKPGPVSALQRCHTGGIEYLSSTTVDARGGGGACTRHHIHHAPANGGKLLAGICLAGLPIVQSVQLACWAESAPTSAQDPHRAADACVLGLTGRMLLTSMRAEQEHAAAVSALLGEAGIKDAAAALLDKQ